MDARAYLPVSGRAVRPGRAHADPGPLHGALRSAGGRRSPADGAVLDDEARGRDRGERAHRQRDAGGTRTNAAGRAVTRRNPNRTGTAVGVSVVACSLNTSKLFLQVSKALRYDVPKPRRSRSGSYRRSSTQSISSTSANGSAIPLPSRPGRASESRARGHGFTDATFGRHSSCARRSGPYSQRTATGSGTRLLSGVLTAVRARRSWPSCSSTKLRSSSPGPAASMACAGDSSASP